ncbi:hypothetical protein J6590_024139 [Homalodisca vitripennis]|nr:hypothetical protein J6590_024139 [Homalodisca vitripennis]
MSARCSTPAVSKQMLTLWILLADLIAAADVSASVSLYCIFAHKYYRCQQDAQLLLFCLSVLYLCTQILQMSARCSTPAVRKQMLTLWILLADLIAAADVSASMSARCSTPAVRKQRLTLWILLADLIAAADVSASVSLYCIFAHKYYRCQQDAQLLLFCLSVLYLCTQILQMSARCSTPAVSKQMLTLWILLADLIAAADVSASVSLYFIFAHKYYRCQQDAQLLLFCLSVLYLCTQILQMSARYSTPAVSKQMLTLWILLADLIAAADVSASMSARCSTPAVSKQRLTLWILLAALIAAADVSASVSLYCIFAHKYYRCQQDAQLLL